MSDDCPACDEEVCKTDPFRVFRGRKTHVSCENAIRSRLRILKQFPVAANEEKRDFALNVQKWQADMKPFLVDGGRKQSRVQLTESLKQEEKFKTKSRLQDELDLNRR